MWKVNNQVDFKYKMNEKKKTRFSKKIRIKEETTPTSGNVFMSENEKLCAQSLLRVVGKRRNSILGSSKTSMYGLGLFWT